MRQTILPIRISAAHRAAQSRPLTSFTGRSPRRLGDGHGIVSASNAGAPTAATIAQTPRICATPDCERGARRTPQPRRQLISVAASNRSMDYRQIRLMRCAKPKAARAPFANAKQRDCWSIIAIPKAMSGPSFARPAIPFLAGTRKRPTRYFNSSATSKATAGSHADVLLELANQ